MTTPTEQAANSHLPDPRVYGNLHHDDIKQAAAIRVWTTERKLGPLEPAQEYVAARMGAIDQVRSWHGRPGRASHGYRTTPIEPFQHLLSTSTRDPGLEADVRAAIAALPHEDDRVYALALLAGFDGAEAAELIGLSYMTAYMRWRTRIRTRLARSLRDYRDSPRG